MSHLCERVLFNNDRYSNSQSLNYPFIFTPVDVYFYRYVYVRGGALKRPIFKSSIRYTIEKKNYNENELLIYQTGVRNMTIIKKKKNYFRNRHLFFYSRTGSNMPSNSKPNFVKRLFIAKARFLSLDVY